MQARSTPLESSEETFRRWVEGSALILAPFLALIAHFIGLVDKESGAEQLQVAVDTPGRWNLGILLALFGLTLFIPAVNRLARMAGDRGAWPALLGSFLVYMGIVFYAAFLGAELVAPSVFATLPAEERAGLTLAMQALVDMDGMQGVVAIIGPVVGWAGGFSLLALGLLLGSRLPRWASGAIIGGALTMVLLPEQWMRGAGVAVLLVGLGAAGLRVLRGDRSAMPADQPAP